MPELDGGQRKLLRKHAHDLDPVIRVGHDGVTDAVVAATNRALDDHELIKVKFMDRKDQKDSLCADLTDKTRSERVGMVGNVAILYRRQADPEKQRYGI